MRENWKSEHDFAAALDYLSLLIPEPTAAEPVRGGSHPILGTGALVRSYHLGDNTDIPCRLL